MLRTHSFGGGTWVSEFASLTGMPQDIFGPGGMYAPYLLAPHVRDTLPQLLRRLGYRTIAIYPTVGSSSTAATRIAITASITCTTSTSWAWSSGRRATGRCSPPPNASTTR
ncbi:sulfatase-like hydrolase/transferase [Rhodanobacter lindaniclasticus]